jgi:hypothetical protein
MPKRSFITPNSTWYTHLNNNYYVQREEPGMGTVAREGRQERERTQVEKRGLLALQCTLKVT